MLRWCQRKVLTQSHKTFLAPFSPLITANRISGSYWRSSLKGEQCAFKEKGGKQSTNWIVFQIETFFLLLSLSTFMKAGCIWTTHSAVLIREKQDSCGDIKVTMWHMVCVKTVLNRFFFKTHFNTLCEIMTGCLVSHKESVSACLSNSNDTEAGGCMFRESKTVFHIFCRLWLNSQQIML